MYNWSNYLDFYNCVKYVIKFVKNVSLIEIKYQVLYNLNYHYN